MLTEVHRQAQDNPIIRMSMEIRAGNRLMHGAYGDSLVASAGELGQERIRAIVLDADQILCGLNRTRVAYNARIRQMRGLAGEAEFWHPALGDKLICLRNNSTKALFNGGLWHAVEVNTKAKFGKPGELAILGSSQDEDRGLLWLDVHEEFFDGTEYLLDWKERRRSDEFTFGWAITCHKSQGSQWDTVVVFDESSGFREARSKWLYTAVTRAAQAVTVIV
jgi:exodeoxyribonuclease-5